MSRYTINHKPHGILIEGPIPLNDMGAIAKLGADNDYDILDAALSGHYADQGVSMVLVNAESGNAWRKELGLESSGKRTPPKKRELGPIDPPFTLHDAGDKERTTLSGYWSRWLNTVADRYPTTEVLLGDKTHHREAFEARNLDALLSRLT